MPRTWILLKQVTDILMEGTPAHIDVDEMQKKLLSLPGVRAVHDLHVWTVTSGIDAMSCHLVVDDLVQGPTFVRQARGLAKREFGIDHVTVQIEDEALRAEEVTVHV